MRRLVIITAAFLCLQFFPAGKTCAKDHDFVYENETIFANTTWSGTVLINDVVTVYEKITLTIEPGTVVMFNKRDTNGDGMGEAEMYVQGEIVAIGTKEKPIIFTSAAEDKKPGDWVAINMMVSEEKRNIFQNCIVENSTRGFHAHFSDMNLIDCEMKNNLLAVQFQDSTVNIKGCNIHGNNQGIQFRDSTLTIENTKIVKNEIGIRCVYSEVDFANNEVTGSSMPAFQIRGSNVKIKNSTFKDSGAGLTAQDSSITLNGSMVLNNHLDGLSLHNSDATIKDNYIMLNGDDGILVDNCSVTIKNNNIYNNAKYNISLEQAADIDAANNYWGTDDVDKVDKFNYDKKDLNTLGEIKIGEYFKKEIGITK